MSDIIVPTMGESVAEGTIARWLKKVGDTVRADELLAEIETDKVTLEVNAPAAGVLSEILVQAGTNVTPGLLIGRIGGSAAATTTPAAAPVVAVAAPAPAPVAAAVPASPAARKVAADHNVNVADVAGTGRDGRVMKPDVLAALSAPAATVVAAAPAAPRTAQERERVVPMSRLRQTIARRLKDAQNTAASLTTFNEIDMSGIIALRNTVKDTFEKRHGVKLGFMSFFVKAVVQALKEVPAVNAEINGTDIIYKDYYHIGVAVGTDSGLVVPVLRDADKMSMAEIEKTIVAYAKAARDGKLSMADMQGGTFTITNGGVYGSLLSTPIINPPQSGILGMHKTQDRPVAVNGQVVIRPMMYLAHSYDHRIIDGREAVTFLVRVKECLEDPRRLLLEV
jgi:2-oxoglutarate dehydrogenase E2 component (dihydrolipoamide succinyltransferase)